MKKNIYTIIFYFSIINYKLISFWAEDDVWVFKWSWLSKEKLRNWDIHIWDIPNVIRALIDYFIWIAWTISVIFIILWAYQMLFGSIWWNSKWKETITKALGGVEIANLSWFIVKLIFDNFS
jgi:hypothetical protein